MPALATKTAELLERLEHLRTTPEIDPFTLKRLQREAHNLLKADAFSAYQILGALEGFTGNIKEMRRNYEIARSLALTERDKSRVLHNYTVSLSDTGYFSEAALLQAESHHQIETAKFDLSHPVQDHLRAGLFHQVAQYAEQATNLDDKLFFYILSVTQFMDKHEVSDQELQRLIEIAVSVLHEHQFFNFYFRNIIIEFAADESSRWFRYVIKVNRSVEEVVEMEYELACQLAEIDLPLNLLSNFITTYECAEK
jgi:hypothetical protein